MKITGQRFSFVSSLVLTVCFGAVCLAIPINEVPTINTLPLQVDGHALDSGAANKKPGSIRDPDAIVYPDEIIRDSYGNPVTPFHGLVEPHLDIGHMTDVNPEHSQLDRRGSFNQTTTKDQSGFVIPSYASGIMKVETLFPNAPIFPLVAPSKKNSNGAADIPEPTFELSNDILPPYKDDEQKVNYPVIEVNTQATIFFPDANFFNQVNGQNPSPTSTKAPTHTPVVNKAVSQSGIYTGGFGGSSGVLGSPQPLGLAYANKGNRPVNSNNNNGPFLDVNLLPPPPPPPSQSVPVS